MGHLRRTHQDLRQKELCVLKCAWRGGSKVESDGREAGVREGTPAQRKWNAQSTD